MRESELSRDELLEQKKQIDTYFPRRPEETTLTLMDVDPYTLHAYWRVRGEDLQEARRRLGADGHERLVLRVYDVTYIEFDGTNEHLHFDIAVNGTDNNWYIDLLDGGKSFLADIGLKGPRGEFVTITGSNVAHVPRDGQSPFCERKALQLLPGGRTRELSDVCAAGKDVAHTDAPTTSTDRKDVNRKIAQYYGCVPNCGAGGRSILDSRKGKTGPPDCRDLIAGPGPQSRGGFESGPHAAMEKRIRSCYSALQEGEGLPSEAPAEDWRTLSEGSPDP